MCNKKDHMLSLRLEEELDVPLKELAERFKVSAAFIVRRYIKAGLKKQSQHCLILLDEDGQSKTA